MPFRRKDIPAQIKPEETAYGRKWALPSVQISSDQVQTQVIIEIDGDRNTAMTAKPEDIVVVGSGNSTLKLRRHRDTLWERVEVAEDSLNEVQYVAKGEFNAGVISKVYRPGTDFYSIEKDVERTGNTHTLFSPSDGNTVLPTLLRITAVKKT